MPHTATGPLPAAAEISKPDDGVVLALVAIRLLTELQMKLGIDPDGSHTATRGAAVLGEYRQVDPTVCIWEEEDRSELQASLIRAANTLRRVRPLMSRLSRAAADG
jgi:hypothetical protein